MIVQVETNTDCNRSCWYCPNAHYPRRPRAVMPLALFEHVLDEVSKTFRKDQLRTISFAAYNEPTLDPFFRERLRLLQRQGFDHYFISNGSGVTESLVDFLVDEKIRMSTIHLNLPAIDPDEYAGATGGRPADALTLQRTLPYLFRRQAETGAEMVIAVHGDGGERHQRNYQRVRAFFRDEPVSVLMRPVMNRAGLLEKIVPPPIDHGTDRVWCLPRYLDSFYIGVQANLYVCCHDYHQVSTYGSLERTPLRELVRSEARNKAIREFKKEFCRRCSFAAKFDEMLKR